jgi:hypothetical protein
MAAVGAREAVSLDVLSRVAEVASKGMARTCRTQAGGLEWHDHVRRLAEVADACRGSAASAKAQGDDALRLLHAALASAKEDDNWSSRCVRSRVLLPTGSFRCLVATRQLGPLA